MQEKIYIIEDYGEKKVFYLTAEDGADMDASLKKAAEFATADGVRGMLSEIPDEYLEKAGLCRKEIPVAFFPDTVLAISEMEKAGIYRAECRSCSSFEDGFCFKYGGSCNPSDENNCCRGDNVYELSYDDDERQFSKKLYIEEDNPKLEDVLEKIQSEFPEVKEILESDYNPEDWSIERMGYRLIL